jgi:hypothetical protein
MSSIPHPTTRTLDVPEDVAMATSNETALRDFCARMIGWAPDLAPVVDHAVRSIYLAASHRAALVLLGDDDLVPVAYALHRRVLGDERPFIVADPRRGNTPASVRSPANYANGLDAFRAARGGSLYVHTSRRPRELSSVIRRVRGAMGALTQEPEDSVQLIVCASSRLNTHPFLALPVPIQVPGLATRTQELPRIIEEYAREASAELGAPDTSFTAADRQWVLDHASRTLGEIEKATLRLAALRLSESLPQAAERLRMAPVSLSRWIDRRKLRSTVHALKAFEQEAVAP